MPEPQLRNLAPDLDLATSPPVTDVRALILSWEYPPLIEGGLARHVRKLAENLAAQGMDVHVLARGREEDPPEAEVGGVLVHRVREPERPRDLGEFVAWIEHMNSDMLAAGVEVGDRWDFDVVHGHDWLVASAGDHLAKRFRAPLVTTIHATEYGRHQGWVEHHPQSYIHGVERWMANRAERVITCSAYMREHVADIYGLEERRISVIPNGIDPSELVPVDDLDSLRARFAAPDERLVLLVGRLVYEKGFQLALEALPRLIERLGKVRFLVAGSGTAEQELHEQAQRARPGRARDVPGLDRRRRPPLALPHRRPDGGALDLRALRPGGPGGDGLGLPLPGVGHRRPARGGASRRRGPALPLARPRLARRDGRAAAHRRELRERMVAEASEHVLSFDWADVARQVAGVYAEAVSASAQGAIGARVDIRAEADVALACREGRALAERLGFGGVELAHVVTAISEIAGNVWRHAGGGRIDLDSPRRPAGWESPCEPATAVRGSPTRTRRWPTAGPRSEAWAWACRERGG